MAHSGFFFFALYINKGFTFGSQNWYFSVLLLLLLFSLFVCILFSQLQLGLKKRKGASLMPLRDP